MATAKQIPLIARVGQSIREVGQAFQRTGSFLRGRYAHLDDLQRTRRVNPFLNIMPQIKGNKFLAPSASVIGDVLMGEGCTVWYNALVRADRGKVLVGNNCHIMDRALIRTGILSVRDVRLGDNVVIESGATVLPCKVGNNVWVGANAVLLEGCQVGDGTVIAPGTVVTEFQELLPNMMYSGIAATESRPLTEEERKEVAERRHAVSGLGVQHTTHCEEATAAIVKDKETLRELLATKVDPLEAGTMRTPRDPTLPSYKLA
eukprot:NODE_3608_length_936_cov_23.805933_g3456_i0.p1 GENE.NODE_3608_length_936_cov_23.805933_g3456_i0~~NODE_3608_length_936_cov_23.805933_g3456_i0.p1  ORF type:complete len:261 (-),score=56.12 NODE_3608_length_936_cov_23.805933_g3456_i0:115-897(-)